MQRGHGRAPRVEHVIRPGAGDEERLLGISGGQCGNARINSSRQRAITAERHPRQRKVAGGRDHERVTARVEEEPRTVGRVGEAVQLVRAERRVLVTESVGQVGQAGELRKRVAVGAVRSVRGRKQDHAQILIDTDRTASHGFVEVDLMKGTQCVLAVGFGDVGDPTAHVAGKGPVGRVQPQLVLAARIDADVHGRQAGLGRRGRRTQRHEKDQGDKRAPHRLVPF